MFQKTMIEWYGSDSLFWKAAGVWLKFIFEFVVAAIPVGVAVLILGFVFPQIHMSIAPSADSAGALWLGSSLSVTGIIWCFSFSTIPDDEEADSESMDEQETLEQYEETEEEPT